MCHQDGANLVLSSLVSIQFPYIVQSRSQSLVSIQFPYIVQSRSQQSGVNPVSLYCTEPVSAVWCQSCILILYRVVLSSLVSIQFPYIVQSRSQQSGVNPVSLYCTESF